MSIPFLQQARVGAYVLGQKLRGRARYPLVLMLEPLFRCNLACPGCGKIAHAPEVLDRRLDVAACLAAAEECGAPVVSLAGGEPLLHPDLPQIVDGLIRQRRFVYLCTNAQLLRRRLPEYPPSPYLTFSVHLDGDRELHDAAVDRAGAFDAAVEAIREALGRGFRVTVNCTLFRTQPATRIAAFFDFVTDLGVEGITVAPGYGYAQAEDRELFLDAAGSRRLFRELFRLGEGHRWRFNHSSLYLDFLAGRRDFGCTPWGTPTRTVLGWQRPCYLITGDGYAETFRELMEETDWERYGRGRNPACADCLTHCGHEPTAVAEAASRPWSALRAFLHRPGRGVPGAGVVPGVSKP